MKIQMLAIAAALSMAAGSAFAEDAAQATLKTPVSAPVHAVAGGATWACDGSSCVTTSETIGDTLSVWSCKTLVRSVGPVSSYSLGPKALTPAQIDRCNKA
jgi:curli biogenesis system outer membrane secretion channel CsgG